MPSKGEANHYFNVMQNVYATYFGGTVWYTDLFPGFNIFVTSSKDAKSKYSYVYWFGPGGWDNDLNNLYNTTGYSVLTDNNGDNCTRPIREF